MRINIGVLVAIIMLSVMPAGVQAQIDEGLVAEWHFDEGSGSVLKDSSGNGNDGVIHGATWVEGKYGKALSFDGMDDYVDVPHSPSLDIIDAITVECWVYYKGGNGRIVQKDDRGSDTYPRLWEIGGYHGNFRMELWHSNEDTTVQSANSLTVSEWMHLTMTFNGNDITMYQDGILSKVYNFPGDIRSNSGTPITIGGYWRSNEWFNGIIDEVRIYNNALTAEEIKAHYIQGPSALSLIKTTTPQSIKQGQTTTITITVKNTGSTEISDIEIADIISPDLTFIEGETSKSYASLSLKDSRQFQYVVRLNEAGTYNLDPATATYADEKGNYHTVKSKPDSIEVIPSLVETTDQIQRTAGSNAQSASVNLHGEKTDVALDEDVLLKLSAVNIIGNPTMHVQVIIIPPSGWSVTSSEFAKSGAGQYTTIYELESGGGKDIEVRIVPNQIGDDFQVEGRIIYYFGDDLATREDHTLNLPITVRAEPDDGEKSSADSEEPKTPGFGVLVACIGLLVTSYLVRRK